MAVLLTTAASATATGLGASTSPQSAPVTAFGGSAAVHVAHVGHIEVDLEPGTGVGLRRIRCAGLPARTAACFVAR